MNEESFLTLSGWSWMLPCSTLVQKVQLRNVLIWNMLEFVFCDIFRSLNPISDHERIRIAWQEADWSLLPTSCPNPITGSTM
jgi:hypothetical protein